MTHAREVGACQDCYVLCVLCVLRVLCAVCCVSWPMSHVASAQFCCANPPFPSFSPFLSLPPAVYWAGAAEPSKLFQSMTSADLLAGGGGGGGQALGEPLGEASSGTSRQWEGSSDTSAGASAGAGAGVGVGVGAAAPIMRRTQGPTSSLGTSYNHKDYRELRGGRAGASGSAAGSHTDAEDRDAGEDSGGRVDRDKAQDREAGLGGPQNMLYGKGAEQQVTTLQITKTQPVHSSSSSACASLSDHTEAEAAAGAGAGAAPEESTLRILEGELASVQGMLCGMCVWM